MFVLEFLFLLFVVCVCLCVCVCVCVSGWMNMVSMYVLLLFVNVLFMVCEEVYV